MTLEVDRIIEGDCLAVMRGWPDACVDMIFCDPPYGIRKAEWDGRDRHHDWRWLDEAARLLKPSGSFYMCWSCRYIPVAQPHVERLLNLRNLLVWNYRNGVAPRASDQYAITWEAVFFATKGRGKRKIFRDFDRIGDNFDVWVIPVPQNTATDKTRKLHPCQKPIRLMQKAILASSFGGDVVLDPFCGSGSTCVAAQALGRHYIGIELDPAYAEMARLRIAGKKPIKDVDEAALPLFAGMESDNG